MLITSGTNTYQFPLDKLPVLVAEWLSLFKYSKFGKFDCIQNNLQFTPEQEDQFSDTHISHILKNWRLGCSKKL